MIRQPPRSTLSSSSAASDVYKRQVQMMRHWIRGVFLITDVEDEGASDGTDSIVAVNITRPVELNDPSMETQALGRAAGKIDRVDVVHHRGGPCMDGRITSITLLHATHPEELESSSEVHVGGKQGGLWVVGPLEEIALLAAQDVLRREEGTRALVKAFWGTARWSRTQLLGELAHGGWGMCRAEAADAFPKEAVVNTANQGGEGQSLPLGGFPDHDEIWEALVEGQPSRLLYAPQNEMSQSYGEEEEEEQVSAADQDAAARDLNAQMAKHREQLRAQLLRQQAAEEQRASASMQDAQDASQNCSQGAASVEDADDP
eukprot:TRINITY_DN49796_c0_g1_i1.p1 TRINITY_DN49796_c0_g1~~TRINITY_DN49796_c0_g1_i1.p1  ORF type:complete len:317 (-),score=103.40 TRINITY_DN49796_c0_g1_i1:142-1092(-)